MPVVWEDENGEEYPHYELAEDIKYDNTNSKLAAQDVQQALDELAAKKDETPSVNNSRSGYYTIFAQEWGLTKSDELPERGKHYCQTRQDLSVRSTAQLVDLDVDINVTYEDMHLNATGIERAINYAYDNNYAGVILEKGIYFFAPESLNYGTDSTYYASLDDYNNTIPTPYVKGNAIRGLATIQIFNKRDFEINLNGSTLCFIVDSNPYISGGFDTSNPYYASDFRKITGWTKNNKTIELPDFSQPHIQTYNIIATLISISCSNNVTLRNGILRGDSYTRSFISEGESSQEQTYGVTNASFTYNTLLKGLDISGFMGDAVGTGAGGSVYIRDYREYIYQPILADGKTVSQSTQEEYIKNENYGTYNRAYCLKHPFTGTGSDCAVINKVKPIINYTTYSYKNSAWSVAENSHSNIGLQWFAGPGFCLKDGAPAPLSAESAFPTISNFIDVDVNNLVSYLYSLTHSFKGDIAKVRNYPYNYWDEYKGRDLVALEIEEAQRAINNRLFTFFANTGSNLYWPRIYVLTYAFDDNKIEVTHEKVDYLYDVSTDKLYRKSDNTLIDKKLDVDSGGTPIFLQVVKCIYNYYSSYVEFYDSDNDTIYYAKYSGASTVWYNANKTTIQASAVPDAIKTLSTQRKNALQPKRVVPISNTGDFSVLADERFVRIETLYDKGYYGEYTTRVQNEIEYPTSFPNNMFTGYLGELKPVDAGYNRDNRIGISLGDAQMFIIDACVIHDNFRGGITGGIKDLIIRNSTFYKRLRNDKTSKVINELGEIPRFNSTTNYALDIEEGFTSNTEICGCRILNGSLLVLSGMNFNFHDNVTYSGVLLRNIINSNIHHNVFYNNVLALDWWKLGSSVVYDKNAVNSEDTIALANDMYSDALGNISGRLDKRQLGASRMIRHVNINNNTIYNYEAPYRYFWKTAFTIANNVMYLTARYSNWSSKLKYLDETIEALRYSRTINNTFINNATYFSQGVLGANYDTGLKQVIPLFGISANNVIENRGGDNKLLAVAPLGIANNNVVINGCVRLGRRYHGDNTYYQYQHGVDIMSGTCYTGATTIYTLFGDPSTKLSVVNCKFDGDISFNGYYNEYLNDDTDRPDTPQINIEEGTDNTSRTRLVWFTFGEDANFTAEKKARRRLYYSLDSVNFTYITENTPIRLDKDTVVMAVVCMEQENVNQNNQMSRYAIRNVYVNNSYSIDGNDAVVGIIEDPEQVVKDGFEEFPTENTWGDARPLDLVFKHCEFTNFVTLPTRTDNSNSNSVLTLTFVNCDFTNVDKNCVIEVKGEVDTNNALSGLVANNWYYDTNTEAYMLAVNSTTLKVKDKVKLKFINCYSNDNFTAHKVE